MHALGTYLQRHVYRPVVRRTARNLIREAVQGASWYSGLGRRLPARATIFDFVAQAARKKSEKWPLPGMH